MLAIWKQNDHHQWFEMAQKHWRSSKKRAKRNNNKIAEFLSPAEDMVQIFIIYIWSILEQPCTLWLSGLTPGDTHDFESVQQSVMRIILKYGYQTYDKALESLGLCLLSDIREKICLKFAKNCSKNELTKYIFPLNQTNGVGTRDKQTFKVPHTNMDRLKASALLYWCINLIQIPIIKII